MEGKKKYFALIIFLFLGLMIFTFANPVEEEKEFKNGDKEQSENVTNKREDTTEDDEDEQEQQDVGQAQQNVITNNNQGNAQGNQGNNPGTTPVDNTLRDALAAVEKAEGTYTQDDVDAAKELVNNVTDTTEKGKLEERLEEVEAGIAVLALLEQLETKVEEAEEKAHMTAAAEFRQEQEIAAKIEALNNETVKEELAERLAEVSKLLDDNAAPTTTIEAKVYGDDVVITAEDAAGNPFKMFLTKNNEPEQEISNGATTDSDGTYTLRLIDDAFNEQTVTFTVDTTAPTLKDLTNGGHYNEITLNTEDLTKVTIKVTNQDKNETTEVEEGTKLTEDATYKVVLTDEAGNTNTYWLAIDTTKPTVSIKDEIVEEKAYINENTEVKVFDKFLTNVSITYEDKNANKTTDEFTRVDFEVGANNENFTLTYELSTVGTYTITGTDKYGNEKTITVIYDKTPAKLVSANMYSTGDKYTETKEGKDYPVYYTTDGDKITAYIRVSEQLKEMPLFTFEVGNTVITTSNATEAFHKAEDETAGIYRYQVTLNVDDYDFDDGDIKMTVSNIKDKAGNESNNVNGVTNRNIVRIDRTEAQRVYSTIRSSAPEVVHENGNDRDYYHKKGTQFEYAISFNELLKEVPTVTIGGRNVEMKLNEKVLKNENKYLYEGTFKIAKDETELTEGTLEIKVTNVKDLAGNETTLADQTKTSNGRRVIYDKTAPKAVSTTYSPNTLTNQNVTVTIKVNEELKPVEGWTLSEDKKSISKEFTKNTKGNVVISDIAGNTVKRYYSISKIDKTAPKAVSTTYSPNTLTNKNVTVTININEEIKPVEGWTLSEDKKSISKEFTKNASGNVEIYDLAGNKVISKYEITHIDKEKPKPVSTTYSPKTATNGNVTVTIKVNEELQPVEGWTLSEDKKSISKEFTENTKGNVVIYDLAGNKATRYYSITNIDKTAAEIILPGQEGELKNQYRILKDSYIAVSYLKAKVTDNSDGETTILPTKFYAYYPKATGIPSGVYNLEEGKYFDTSIVGVNYEVQYEYTDTAGNKTKKSMLLIVDAPYVPEIVDNVIDVKYDLLLNDKPFYNDKTRTAPLTINGNGNTITQEIDTDYKYTWDKSGTRPMQSNMFTSANNSLVTVNDLNFAGTMYSMTLGHYVSTYADQGKFTTILNNVNMINTKVASFSANKAPAMSIYGKATLNDVNVYGTTLSELDTDPMWPVYDIITLNYSDTTINRGKIGTIYTWGNARLEINGTEVDTITSAMRTGSGYGVNYGLIIGDNTKVNKITMTSANASITVKSTAEIGTLDLCANDESGMYLNIEPGAKIGKVIIKNGDSCKKMTYDEWYKNITTSEKLFTAMALGGELKLAANLEVKQQLNIPTGVNVVLDMNGKTLTMADSYAKANKNYTVMINMEEGSDLTIKGNGTIDLEDNYKDVFIIPRGNVTIENGNFLKDADGAINKYQSFFAGVKYGKGKMVIKDGYFDFGYYNEDSLYYNAANGLNLSYDQDVKIYGGTFVGQNPAYGDESSAATSPAVNLNHCQGTFFEGQNPTDTEIPSTYTVEEGTHTDGRPTYKVTYTPAQ